MPYQILKFLYKTWHIWYMFNTKWFYEKTDTRIWMIILITLSFQFITSFGTWASHQNAHQLGWDVEKRWMTFSHHVDILQFRTTVPRRRNQVFWVSGFCNLRPSICTTIHIPELPPELCKFLSLHFWTCLRFIKDFPFR